MLQGQLGCLQVKADGEVPSTFGYELDWLTCKLLFAQRLVPYFLVPFAIDLYYNVFVSFAERDLDVDIGSVAVFEAEDRLPEETRATCQTTHKKENDNLYTYQALTSSSCLCLL